MMGMVLEYIVSGALSFGASSGAACFAACRHSKTTSKVAGSCRHFFFFFFFSSSSFVFFISLLLSQSYRLYNITHNLLSLVEYNAASCSLDIIHIYSIFKAFIQSVRSSDTFASARCC